MGLMLQVQWRSNDDSLRPISDQQSLHVTVRIAWNPGQGGTKKVPGTVPSGKPPKSEPYRAVPCSGKAPLVKRNPSLTVSRSERYLNDTGIAVFKKNSYNKKNKHR